MRAENVGKLTFGPDGKITRLYKTHSPPKRCFMKPNAWSLDHKQEGFGHAWSGSAKSCSTSPGSTRLSRRSPTKFTEPSPAQHRVLPAAIDFDFTRACQTACFRSHRGASSTMQYQRDLMQLCGLCGLCVPTTFLPRNDRRPADRRGEQQDERDPNMTHAGNRRGNEEGLHTNRTRRSPGHPSEHAARTPDE